MLRLASIKIITGAFLAPFNTVVFLVLVLSMLMGAEETGRWKVVAVAIGSIVVQAALRELFPGMFGAIVAVIVTVIFVGTALVTWCEIERPLARKALGAYFGCSLVLSVFSALLSDLAA
jgi:di/tricarboxylate transporter